MPFKINFLFGNKLLIIFSALCCSLLGFIVLVGWHTNIPALIQINNNLPPMQYNTALFFLLMGIGLISFLYNTKKIALIIGLFVFTTSLLTFLQYVFPINTGIDQLFIKAYITTNTFSPGRMALPFTPNMVERLNLWLHRLIKHSMKQKTQERIKLSSVKMINILG